MHRAPVAPVSLLFVLATLAGTVAHETLPAQTPTPAVLRPTQRYTLVGVVTDSARVPLANADVGLNIAGEVVAVVRTGADGRFQFDDLLPVRAALRVRHATHKARTVAVDIASDSARSVLAVALGRMSSADAAAARRLDTANALVVLDEESEDPGGRLRPFYERRARHRFAYFYDREQIRRQNTQFTSEMLRTVPGAVIRASARLGNTVRLRGCRPMVWVDGMRMPDAELDELARPSDVAALEIYPTLGAIPPQFADMPSQCGSIVVWTR